MNRFSLHQRLRYDYTSPVRRLQHRLMVLPPAVHGDQTRLSYRIEVHGNPVEAVESVDRFGNVVIDVRARRVADHVEFEAWSVVERGREEELVAGPEVLAGLGHAEVMLVPSALTAPDTALRAAATRLARSGDHGLDLADRVNAWVFAAMRYGHDVTSVRTTAAQALAVGAGVCQDYAHVMLALCRLLGLPARYVSGHLQGEGGSHAWVEVLDPSAGAVAFDPTNDRRAGPTYLTIATGRDYADVAPTYGTFCGTGRGSLTTSKELTVSAVDLLHC